MYRFLKFRSGNKDKNGIQVKHPDNYVIASDNIETGSGNKARIYLFEFLY